MIDLRHQRVTDQSFTQNRISCLYKNQLNVFVAICIFLCTSISFTKSIKKKFCPMKNLYQSFSNYNSTTMHNGNIQLLATELFIVKNGLSPPFMNDVFVENAQHYCDLRKKTEFKRNNFKRCTTELKL